MPSGIVHKPSEEVQREIWHRWIPPSIYYSARRFDAVNSIDRSPANTADIVASGALIWRMRDGALEVLIIHRPRYDDWSWPKGKQDPGESLAETAIREIREEVSLQVVLGVPLAVTSYPVGGRPKDVFYWAAELPEAPAPWRMRVKWMSCAGYPPRLLAPC